MGLYIARIEIKNFRNFKHLVLDPVPARAVIVGENGVGKSNLLHALRLVLDPSLPDTARLLTDDDIWEGSAVRLRDGVVVSVVVDLAGFDDDDAAKALLASSLISTDPYRARLTYQFHRKGPLVSIDGELEGTDPLTSNDYEFVVFGNSQPLSDVSRVRRYVALRVLPALRDAESDLQNWRRNPLRELLERLPLDAANLEATATAIAAAVAQLTSDANIGLLESQLRDRLVDMAGAQITMSPTLGFASTAPGELTKAVRLFTDTAGRRSVADGSLGAANVLYLCLLMEALEQQRQADDFITTIVAVEEPEAHLHVTLQRRLFRYLLRTEDSLILTTHSPHIAAVSPLDAIVLLRRVGDSTVGATTAALTVEPTVRADLERYLDVSRAEVLFARYVILVEGLAELYVVPALARACGFDLDEHGVVVASVHGTDFAPYLGLLGPSGLSVPFVLITDGDSAEDARGTSEAGLARGVRLVDGEGVLASLLDAVRAATSDDRPVIRRELVSALEEQSVFIGEQTLELDLCRLVGNQIIAAYQDLDARDGPRSEVRAGVTAEAAGAQTDASRAGLMRRIEGLGKGRFAQRLAAHIEVLTPTGPAEALLESSHVLRALNAVSQSVRGVPLLESEAGSAPEEAGSGG